MAGEGFRNHLSELDKGLVFMSCNLKCDNSKLLKINHLSKFLSITFIYFTTFWALFHDVCEVL